MDEPEALPHDIKAGESPCRKEGRDIMCKDCWGDYQVLIDKDCSCKCDSKNAFLETYEDGTLLCYECSHYILREET